MFALEICTYLTLLAVAWWLSGYDSSLEGDGRRTDFWRRFLRIVATLFVVVAMVCMPALAMFFAVFIGVIWASCVAELVSRRARTFIDPGFHDDRPLDLKKFQRHQDAIAQLIHHGKRDEAIRLCEELQKSGELDATTLATALEFLGVKQTSTRLERPLNEAARLRTEGKFSEAETLLQTLLQKNPADEGAALALMRLYAEDRRQPGKAHEILRALEKQRGVSAAHVEFARRSMDEWSKPKLVKTGSAAAPKAVSLEELLAQKSFGSAVELLERQIEVSPDDFDLRLKLAEVQAVHCANVARAEKIFRQATAENRFSAAQAAVAAGKLKEWREMNLPRK